MNIVHKQISIYAENARLKKRVAALRKLLNECKAEVIALTNQTVVLSGVILK